MKNERKKYLSLALYTMCVMLFCAGSSPITNGMGTDSSVFFTIGRSMRSGKIAYVDLFDHKGWYIYFFNFLGACISDKTTWGLFIIESIFMFVNVLAFYKIADLLLGKDVSDTFKFITVSLLLLLSLNFLTYQGGNFVESYGLTFQLTSVLLVIKYYKQENIEHFPLFMLIHGFCAGIMFGLRANMAAMWGAVAAVILVRLLIYKKYKNMLINIVMGILGVFAGLLPIIIYCLKTGSLWEMIKQSILFNMTYSSSGSFLQDILKVFIHYRSFWIALGGIVSIFIVVKAKKFTRSFRVMYIMAFLLSIFSVAISGRNYGHYYEYLILFLIPVVLAIVKKWYVYFQKYLRHSLVIVTSLFVLTLMVNLQTPIRILGLTNVQKISKGADAMGALYKKEYSHKKTMLVVNNKSMFYNKFNLIPKERYFYIPAIDYRIFPDAVDAQAESMLSGDNDILIISYGNYAKRWILPYGIKNKEILRCLEQKYQMVYEQNHIEMYVKKEYDIKRKQDIN